MKLLFVIFLCVLSFSHTCYFSLILHTYGLNSYHQSENVNTGSRLFTEVKPCWTGLIPGWVTIWIKYLVLYFVGSQAGVVKTSITSSTSTTNAVCGLSFSRSQPDFGGFLRVLRFPPSAKSTPSLFHLAVEGRK